MQAMKVCIYCQKALTPRTRWAHVWPRSMGGRISSREICCDDCNNAIGDTEDEVRAALQHVNATLGARKDDGTPIAVRVTIDGMEFEKAGALADLQVPEVSFDPKTKWLTIPLPAGFDNQVEAVARTLRRHGFVPDDLVGRTELTKADEPTMPPSGVRWYDLSIGGTTAHKQVFAKMAIELLAYHDHSLANRGELSVAR